MTTLTGAARLWVDFNEVYDGDYVWTSVRQTPAWHGMPQMGDHVELYDDDGVTCIGIVRHVEGPIVAFKIDWSTWREDPFKIDPIEMRGVSFEPSIQGLAKDKPGA